MSNNPNGADLRQKRPSDPDWVPKHHYHDMPALKAYMASDAYKDANPAARALYDAAIRDEALYGDSDRAYEHFAIAGGYLRDIMAELPDDYDATPEELSRRIRTAVSEALLGMLRTVHGDDVMLDVLARYIENHSTFESCIDLGDAA